MKKFIAILSAMCIFSQSVSASILGTFVTSWSVDIADKVIYNHNKFMSEQSGVGQQSEHFAVYTPNDAVKPIVVSGEYLWGRETITQAEDYMKKKGLVPMIGVNASYFSYETGLPMGHVISNGKIASKDTLSYQSIGFNPDGTAFIAPLEIKTTLSFQKYGESVDVDIAHINKYNQKIMDIVNLYTPEFSQSNHTECPSLSLIMRVNEGELTIGGTLSATIEEKFNYDGSIKLPEDKLVITVNEIAKPEL
ncbi:MAG: phosphodiester glycosidase family protein, partial [Ruminococcaceae bacterium]|nr:phosphodiester glycosidase family protein [Oscillospiraceae bacterium]